jgi:hypothetical protein
MFQCNRCHKTFQDSHSDGVEEIFGKLYCVGCGEQLIEIDISPSAPAQLKHDNPSARSVTDNSVSSTSNSNNTTITNIYKGEENEKVETRYGLYKKEDVSLCKSCKEYIPKSYFISDTGVCQDCMVKIQMNEGDGALGEGLYEEAKDCYEKVLKNTYGNEKLRHELLFKLGVCYFELHEGKKAVGYFAKTRNQFADSIYYLGRCSEIGLGKDQNFNTAVQYYQEAAQKGSQLAQNELERIEQENIEQERLKLERLEKLPQQKDTAHEDEQENITEDQAPQAEGTEVSVLADDNNKAELSAPEENLDSPINTAPIPQETATIVEPPTPAVPQVTSTPEPLVQTAQGTASSPEENRIYSTTNNTEEEGFLKRYSTLITAATILLLILVGMGFYTLFSSKDQINVNPEKEKPKMEINEPQVVATEAQPEEVQKKEPKSEVKETISQKEATTESAPQPQAEQATSGTIDLSYGKYTGQLSGGYPNGTGRLVYNTARQINKYDTKKRMAQPGESVQGTFVNGFFTIGKHYDANGNLIEAINVGVVDGVYESK